ncbi:MAG: biotin--[acetyl-CoA-carboxylase] ligase [Pseudomonadota bacterium]|nr:biotin--[acetyl-CoA-carboxylase] ligase [Pseudomonadota bacterium]
MAVREEKLGGGWQWLDFDEADSTNNVVRALTEEMASGSKVVVSAVRQTAGRGRRGRQWIDCAGNLFMSLAAEASVKGLGRLVLLSSLCLFKTIKELSDNADAKVELKWPNDVLVNGGKISGILLEKGSGDYFVIGIGVNIAASPKGNVAAYPLISLREAGIDTDRVTFLKNYVAIWDKTRDTWDKEGFEPLRQMWLANVKGLGEEINVTDEKETKKGIFSGVDEDGALLLGGADGIRKIRAGDVFYIKENVE